MKAGHDIVVSPAGTWACTLELLCRDARAAEFTPDSARYLHVRATDADTLLLFAERQWECCNNGRQWVATIDTERIVIVQHAEDHQHCDLEFKTYWWAVEFYLTDDAFEDRLDELATVAVVA